MEMLSQRAAQRRTRDMGWVSHCIYLSFRCGVGWWCRVVASATQDKCLTRTTKTRGLAGQRDLARIAKQHRRAAAASRSVAGPAQMPPVPSGCDAWPGPLPHARWSLDYGSAVSGSRREPHAREAGTRRLVTLRFDQLAALAKPQRSSNRTARADAAGVGACLGQAGRGAVALGAGSASSDQLGRTTRQTAEHGVLV